MNPEQLKTLADSEFDRALLRKNLRETANGSLTVAHNGGLFPASMQLIAFLETWKEVDNLVVEDIYNNPIMVNVPTLLEKLKEQYSSTMLVWYNAYQNSNRIRRADGI